jgi:Crinkler effector protein N-terminal domain
LYLKPETQTQQQSNTMLLFCWLFSDTQPFPVKTNRGQTAGELKKPIVAEDPNRFRDTSPIPSSSGKESSVKKTWISFAYQT